jgi:hypothetical protein
VIEPVKSSFTENEPVQVRANLYNERGEPEPEAFIELEIFAGDDDEPSKCISYESSAEMKFISAELGKLSAGDLPAQSHSRRKITAPLVRLKRG